uniref:Fanconi anemia core complex-associated protein 24 n=1 Tax=Ictidomys tridecemlineatus TaxID=43179 RepID=UPI00038BBFDD|nr:Fanconi anemia core complex-associated protein 24 [Ictidomys tridecemlineatus]
MFREPLDRGGSGVPASWVLIPDWTEQPQHEPSWGTRAQVQEQSKEPSKNPFLKKKRALLSEPYLLRTVQQIPGVGKVKASLLLQKFPSIHELSNASVQELELVVGQVVAQQIHTFFTQSR